MQIFMLYLKKKDYKIEMKKLILIFVLIFILRGLLYADRQFIANQEITSLFQKEEIIISNNFNKLKFLDFINKSGYLKTSDKKEEDKQILREKWKDLLNIDIFYPYFLKKDIEKFISEKTKIEFFNIKGKAEFEDNQVKYIFKAKF